MYGVKGTSAFVNTVARQGVLSKQLTAAQTSTKTSAFLSSLPSRTVPAKLSYTTSRASSQFGSSTLQDSHTQQDPNDNRFRFQHRKLNRFSSQVRFNHSSASSVQAEPIQSTEETNNEVDARIQKAAAHKEAKDVVKEFNLGKTAGARLSVKAYDAVLDAYKSLRRQNQPLTTMMSVHKDMVDQGIQLSPHTYAVLIQSLCVRHQEVMRTLAMLRRHTARAGSHANNMKDLESENNIDHAVALFEEAIHQKATQELDIDVYNGMLRGLSVHGRLKDALYVYEQLEISKIQPNSTTFATLVTLFGNVGDLQAVNECFNEYKLVRRHLPHHNPAVVYNALVGAHVNAGDFPAALDIVESMMVKDSVRVSISPYNTIIGQACAQDNIELASEILAKLISDEELPKPNSNTYGMLLTTHSRLGNMEKATECYDKLLKMDPSKQFGHLADYVALCASQNKPEVAMSVLDDMFNRGMHIDSSICRLVVASFLNSRDASEAGNAFVDLFRKHAQSKFVDGSSPVVQAAFDIVGQGNNLSTSMVILRCLTECTVPPTPEVAQTILRQYMNEHEQTDHWAEISKTLDAASYYILYETLFRSRMPREEFATVAFAIHHDMLQQKLDPIPSVYVRVASRLAKYDFEDLLERWKTEVEPHLPSSEVLATQVHPLSFHNEQPDVSNLITAETDIQSGHAVSAAVKGDFEQAIRIIKNDIMGHGKLPTPAAVRDIIRSAFRLKQGETAREIYDLVIESMETRLEGRPRQRALHPIYNGMLMFYARNNDLSKTVELYEKLRENSLLPEADTYGSILSCAKSETIEAFDVLKIYNEAKLHKVRLTAYFYNVILSKLGKNRKIELALDAFDEMSRSGLKPNTITYATMVSACLRCKSEKRAVRFFNEMISQPQYSPRIGTYNNMIQYYVAQMPDRTKALNYYELAMQHKVEPSGYTYKLLIDAYASIAPYDMVAAYNLLSQMKTRHRLTPESTHYASLIRAYGCVHHDVTSALAVLKEMEKAGMEADETVYKAMVEMYMDNGQKSEAERLCSELQEKGISITIREKETEF